MLKYNVTPIGDSYASVFKKLSYYDKIAPIPPNHVDPVQEDLTLLKDVNTIPMHRDTMLKAVGI